MKPQSRRESSHPVIDETAFQQLLSAAYVMQEHNNRLKKSPQPAAQAAAPVAIAAKPAVVVAPNAPPLVEAIPFPAAAPSSSAGPTCQECGSTLAPNEFFCENCGAPAARPNTMQKNWASLWEMHQASQPETKVAPEEKKVSFTSVKTVHSEEAQDEEIDLFPSELEEIVGKFSQPGDEESETKIAGPETSDASLTLVTATPQPAESAVLTPSPSAWTSAAKARAWLDSLKPQKSKDWFREEWTFHRGMIAIALASAVLLAVLFQWATQPAAVPGHTRELSGFEQMLVSLGLAEAPAPVTTSAPVPGNPDTKVWVDVHTALYYCPGADLYGKTANGKYTSQLDAQRDHFQPSTLKACD